MRSKCGQRALGQCRVGVDTYEEYNNPPFLCFRNKKVRQDYTGRQVHSVVAKCFSEIPQDHDESDWICCRMAGVLDCWFTIDEMTMRYTHK